MNNAYLDTAPGQVHTVRNQHEGLFPHIKVDRSSKPIGWSFLKLSLLAGSVACLIFAMVVA